jgi:hypothetical protein
MSTSNKTKSQQNKETQIKNSTKAKSKVEYFSQSCCTRNRVNNFMLADAIDIKLVKMYMSSAFSRLDS